MASKKIFCADSPLIQEGSTEKSGETLVFDKNLESVLHEILNEMKNKTIKPPSYYYFFAIMMDSEKVIEKINIVQGSLSIVSGLIISCEFPLLISPPDSIGSLPNDDYNKICYFVGLCLSLIFLVGSILLMISIVKYCFFILITNMIFIDSIA